MLYQNVDDLRIVSGDRLLTHEGVTATVLVKNEMYFLPSFLDYYRNLGVERFVILDDRSDDGSREFLEAQDDVMLVVSDHNYGDRIFPDNNAVPFSNIRMLHAWKTLLVHRYNQRRWALVLDADEFIVLPNGMTMPDLISKAEATGARGLASIMLDMYPESISELQINEPFNLEGKWYFDGERHMQLVPDNRPRMLYHGVRTRLESHHLKRETILRRSVRKWRRGCAYAPANWIFKVPLVKWQPHDFFPNSHWPGIPVSTDILLPMKHFKFTSDLYRRMQSAIQDRSFTNRSTDYDIIVGILRNMQDRDASFLYRKSRLGNDFHNFVETGNAIIPTG